jgi:hypothetical protein
MKPLIYTFLCMYLIACSPYKKITVTASDRLSKRWAGETEQAVKASVGPYKEKTKTDDGYLLRFDYSYLNIAELKKQNGFQVKANNQPSNIMTPNTNDNNNTRRSADDSVIMRMDFYFDKSEHVKYVMAAGFPDSVYYIKRK